jgi:CDP-glycerol glycerophosphotransferase (TagB/SpsB family)
VFRTNLISATQIDYLASSSSHFDAFWVKAFGPSKLLRTGQARNEVLCRDAHHLELIDSVFTEKEEAIFSKDSTKVLVAPTWQRSHETWINSENFLNTLNEIGKKENIDFFIKQHPFTLRMGEKNQTPNKRNHVHTLDPGFDVYPWLRFFSAMISDYSSIMFDYLATGMPVLSLDLEEKKTPYEPDFSLLPATSGLYQFTSKNFQEILNTALKKHPKRAEQKEMIGLFYETNIRETNQSLINFLEEQVNLKATKSYEVHEIGTRP